MLAKKEQYLHRYTTGNVLSCKDLKWLFKKGKCKMKSEGYILVLYYSSVLSSWVSSFFPCLPPKIIRCCKDEVFVKTMEDSFFLPFLTIYKFRASLPTPSFVLSSNHLFCSLQLILFLIPEKCFMLTNPFSEMYNVVLMAKQCQIHEITG